MSTRQSTGSGNLSKEQVLGLLGHEHRYAIITYFDREMIDSASFDDLIDYIVSLDPKRGEFSAERRKRVTIGLLHNHLPRLADAGVLEYDQRSETVRYWGDSRLETILEGVPSDEYLI
ncbi:hypothetical protein ACFFQF_28680 [Haladaptatus pallidirubidus]|uniref:DUF7344 domain-containing protein n=1 Tax=Haladaptatus pallidirubidus TaxID=1008152 RepID=A0AAV3UJL8_9EURY|nr:hypothetical protein [Haladaptatus pallidirubidus]